MNRETVYETEDFRLEMEVGPEGEIILHMPRLRRWSLSVYKQLLVLAANVASWAGENDVSVIFTGAPVEDTNTLKFQTMLGFEPWKIVDFKGAPFQIMRQFRE